MNSSELLIGAAVYHSVDLADEPESLSLLLEAAGRLVGRQHFAFFHGMLAADQFTRAKKADQANLLELLTDMRGRVFKDLEFHEVRRKPGDGSVRLHLDLSPAQSARAGGDEIVRFPFRAYLIVPRGTFGSAKQLIAILSEIQDILRSPYAFIHTASQARSVIMEVTGIPIAMLSNRPTSQEEAREQRLYRCQRARALLGDVVCGAYWGNLLGSEMVQRLGGAERIRAEAPVAAAYELSGNRVALQLTEEIVDSDVPEMTHLLHDLNRYLSPVSIPNSRLM